MQLFIFLLPVTMKTSCSVKVLAFLIALVFGGMFICPAIAAVVQERTQSFCHHENPAPKTTDDLQMRCCGQQAIAVNQFSAAADDESNRAAALSESPALNEVPHRISTQAPVFRFFKTADHLASLSVLRI
jgi:hypothetical protein